MQLVINTYGSYLHCKDGGFEVKTDEKNFNVSVKKVSSILITTAAFLSTDALKLAMDNNIDVVFLDHFGDPYGRVWHSKLGSTVLIRRRQIEISETEKGLNLAKEWIRNKFNNQIDFLLRLRDSRTKMSAEITSALDSVREICKQLDNVSGVIDEARQTILGIEGSAGRAYFDILSRIMPERYRFEGRSRNPAKDEFNCFLNYGYGVFYSLVEKACIIAGIDPYVGIIHTDNYNKKSMVFDLIENYRIWVDETVVSLFAARKVKEDQFGKLENGFTLDKPGKAVLLTELNEFLDTQIRYRGRNIKRRDIIQFDAHRIANNLIGRIENETE